jgi:enamine deaminase RidA (YjgF/YER057c/UK114 family)
MKILTIGTATLLAVLPLAVQAQAVNRIGNTPQANILTGAVVAPGVEIYHLSGQLASAIDPSKPAASVDAFGDTKTQTVSIFNKIKGLMMAQGYAMSDIFKMTVFVTAAPGMDGKMDFAGFNAGYREFFGTPENPNKVARSTVQVVGLAGPFFLIEIEVTAARMPGKK